MIKNIAFIHKHFPYGGAERITIDIARYTSLHEFRSYVFTWNHFPQKMPQNTEGFITVLELPDKTEQHSPTNINFIIEKINELHIQIFLIQGDELPSLPELKSKTQGCHFIFFYHGNPFCEATYMEIAETERHTKGRPLLKRLEWKYIRNRKFKWTHKYKKIALNGYQRLYDQVDAFVVLCNEYKNTFIKEMQLDAEHHKIHVIHNPETQIAHPNLNKKKQILFMGRMTYPDKRIDRLINIWNHIYKKVPEWELLLVGDGPEKENLEKLAVSLGTQRIKFMGHCSHPAEYYQNAAILCLTSTTEGWPLCLTEAQANGVIPIAYACSAGVKEILSPTGTNGFLIPPFHKRTYEKTLCHLLLNQDLQKQMQQHVIQKAKDYSIEQVGSKWVELFNRLLTL